MHPSRVAAKVLPGLVKNYLGKPTPLIWVNKVTFKCNCKCRFCPCWKIDSDDELNTTKAVDLIHQARNLGVVFSVFEGGEPLLRNDLPIMLEESRKAGMVNTVITNGLLLKKRLPEILPHTDVIIVSLDGSKSTHSKIRNNADAFSCAIDSARETIPKKKFFFSCVINKDNLNEITDLVSLAKDMGTYISFCPCANFNGTEDLKPSPAELNRVMGELMELKEKGYPIINSHAYLKAVYNGKRFTCKTGSVFLHTDPQGNVVIPCYAWKGEITSFDSIRKKSLKDIWFSEGAGKLRKESEECWGCNFSDCVEVAMILSGRLDSFTELYKQYGRI